MTAVADNPVDAARRTAIEESGWSRKVNLVQPRNFTFWVALFLLVAGVFNLYAEVRPAVVAYTTSLAQGTVYFALLGAFILWIILQLDRYSRIPGNVVFLAIIIGGTVSTFATAQLYNDAFLGILTKTQGSGFVRDWGPGLTAPLSEEIAKLLPLILVLGIAPRVVRCAFDGFVLGMLGGLAFQIFESVTYVYNAADKAFGDATAGVPVLFLRTVFGFTGHWMWSGVVGAGLIYLIGRPNEPARRGLGMALIIAPMLVHGAWDAATALGVELGEAALGYLIMVALAAATVVLLVWTYRHTVPRERQWMRDILAPEVEAGVISEDEMEAAVGRRKARRKYVKSKSGRAAERSARYVLDAAHDLADRLAASGGQDSPDVDFARAEIVRLRA